jgi:CheY-like chemotaxis protein
MSNQKPFRLYLRLHQLPSNDAGAVRKSMRPKKTILCVDDNEQALSVRKFMLETRGYRVLTAKSGDEALGVFRNGTIDLVLSDLIMPQMDGNELIRHLKEFAPDVPMILISGSVKSGERAVNADAFLPKGTGGPAELLERIRIMMARKRGPKKSTSGMPFTAKPLDGTPSHFEKAMAS